MATYRASCKCGWGQDHAVETVKRAEVDADIHEARDVRRPYRHSTTVEETK